LAVGSEKILDGAKHSNVKDVHKFPSQMVLLEEAQTYLLLSTCWVLKSNRCIGILQSIPIAVIMRSINKFKKEEFSREPLPSSLIFM